MRLVSINGMSCKDSTFDDIMDFLRGLSPEAPIQLEIEALRFGSNMEASQGNPIPVSVQCAPVSAGEDCEVTFNVELTLEPWVAKAVRFKQVRSIEGQRLMMVESVKADSEAFRRGVRPKMVLRSIVGGSGRHENEEWKMDNLRSINTRLFEDAIRLARFPLTLTMTQGVKFGSEESISPKDRRISMAYERRKFIEEVDETRMDGGRDFPLVGLLAGCTVFTPSLILALNFY